MSIESHVLTGLAGGVAGFVGGTIAGAKIQSLRDEMDKNKAIAKLGGISLEDQQELEGLYETVLKALASDLDAEKTGLTGLGEEILGYARSLCLPQTIPGESFARIPNLRNGLPDKEDLLGTRAAAFEYFDAYYREKGAETDKYVAQVRVLDNLHTLLLRYIDIVKKQPGQAAAKVLVQLGQALTTLQTNFEVVLAHRRQFDIFNRISTTKRGTLIALLKQEDTALMDEALTAQRQITLTESCQQSLDQMIETAGLMGEFFLRSLDKNASETPAALGIAKMMQQEVQREITQSSLKTVSPIGEVVGDYLSEIARFKREPLTDAQSFEERAYHLKCRLKGKIQRAFKSAHLPAFLPITFLSSNDVVKAEILKPISDIFELLHNALSLQEEIKIHVNEAGRAGLVNLELKQFFVETCYQQAVRRFQQLVQTHPYYIYFFEQLSLPETLRKHVSILPSQKPGEALSVTNPSERLKSYVPPSVTALPSIIHTGLLEKLTEKVSQTQHLHRDIVGDPLEAEKASNLPCAPFLTTMAHLCVRDKILFEAIEAPLNKMSPVSFAKDLDVFCTRIKTLSALREKVRELRKFLPAVADYLGNPQIKKLLQPTRPGEFGKGTYFTSLLEEIAILTQAIEPLLKDDASLPIDMRREKYHSFSSKPGLNSYSGAKKMRASQGGSQSQTYTPTLLQEAQELYKKKVATADASLLRVKLRPLLQTLKTDTAQCQAWFGEADAQTHALWEAKAVAQKLQDKHHREKIDQIKTVSDLHRQQEEALRVQREHITQLEIARDQQIEKNRELAHLSALQEIQQKDLKNQLVKHSDENAVLKSGMKTLNTINAEIRAQNDALQSETQGLETFALKLLERAQHSIEKLILQIQGVQKGVDDLEALLKLPHTENTDTTAMENLKQSIVAQVAKLRDLIKDMEADLQEKDLELPNRNQKLQEKFKTVKTLLSTQKESLTASDEKIAELTTYLEKAYQEIAALKEKLEDQNILIKQHEEKIKNFETTQTPSAGTVETTLRKFQKDPSLHKAVEIKGWLSDPKFIEEMYVLHRKGHCDLSRSASAFAQDTRLAFLVEWIGQHFNAQDLRDCFRVLGATGQRKADKSRLKAMRDLSELLHVYNRFLDSASTFPSGRHPLKKISKAAGEEARVKLHPGLFNHRQWGRHWQYVSSAYVPQTVQPVTKNVDVSEMPTTPQSPPPLPVWKKSRSSFSRRHCGTSSFHSSEGVDHAIDTSGQPAPVPRGTSFINAMIVGCRK